MTWQVVTAAAVVVCAGVFGIWVPLEHLADAFQPLVTAVSIMIAGILVRLNRGMPTLDWKGLAAEGRDRLTTAIVDLNREYLIILGINAALVLGLLALMTVGKATLVTWPDNIQRTAAVGVGALLALAVAQVAYMVWRDFDIVRLQKRLIDGVAEKERLEQETANAERVVESARSANLRRVGSPSVRDWNS